ncbi:MAG: glycine C-acetyltransferase [Acidobacteriota bacterium]|jgi:glycine C-acetyltransferase|nr:glycine C-acetyltransferase [Acidobacteriota bacterium]
MDKLQFISDERARLEREGLLVNVRTIESPQGAWIAVDGKRVLNLCSNNYLGFANHPQLKQAARQAIDAFGVGPAAVRSIAGTMTLHTELEKKLAQFKRVEAAISFQSGFNSNVATIPALVGKEDLIFSDELNHASIIDGCRLSGAPIIRYAHCNPASLEQKLKEHYPAGTACRALIITDGVFSMDGDVAPLPALVELAEKYNAMIMVDDAHGEGVLGEGGRGAVDHFHMHGRVDVEIGTLSKAFGVIGGFVAGKKIIVEHLRQKGRPFLFSSALTPADVAACSAAIDILESSSDLVQKLWSNTRYFKQRMKDAGFDIGVSETPITPVMLGDVKVAQEFSRRLFEQNVFAMAIGFPTVPMGKARIRVMISATHSEQDLDYGIEKFKAVAKEIRDLRFEI